MTLEELKDCVYPKGNIKGKVVALVVLGHSKTTITVTESPDVHLTPSLEEAFPDDH